VGQYDKVLVDALHEVADAIANRRELDAELIQARNALEQSDGAYRVARLRYRAGLSRYTDALTAEDTLVTQRRTVAALETRAFALDVALVSALGGGFTDAGSQRASEPLQPTSAPSPLLSKSTGN
jgi:outer membrane protein TolC